MGSTESKSASVLKIGKVYTGTEFNYLTKSMRFVRLTNKKENHNGFQYKTGLNVDHLPFNPSKKCKAGGLYFCDFNDFNKFIKYNDKMCVNMRAVIIPDDAKVYVETGKYKADKFMLSGPVKFLEDEKLCIELVK